VLFLSLSLSLFLSLFISFGLKIQQQQNSRRETKAYMSKTTMIERRTTIDLTTDEDIEGVDGNRDEQREPETYEEITVKEEKGEETTEPERGDASPSSPSRKRAREEEAAVVDETEDCDEKVEKDEEEKENDFKVNKKKKKVAPQAGFWKGFFTATALGAASYFASVYYQPNSLDMLFSAVSGV